MFDESAFRRNDVKKDKTAEFTFHGLELGKGPPVMIVAPAFDINKPFWNARIKKFGKGRRKVDADTFEQDRENDRELFPLYVSKGWRSVCDRQKEDVSFTKEACREFLDLLPDWQFDDLRNFAADPLNFVEGGPLDDEDTEKNSASGSDGNSDTSETDGPSKPQKQKADH